MAYKPTNRIAFLFALLLLGFVHAEKEEGSEEAQCQCRERCSRGEYETGRCPGGWWWEKQCCKLDCEDCRCTDQHPCNQGETFVGYCRETGWQYKCCKCEVEVEGNGNRMLRHW